MQVEKMRKEEEIYFLLGKSFLEKLQK